MKFLYLKGIDIFGPFEVDEIIKEDCFSDDLLVCPEDKAEQEAAWKPAAFYEEFKSALENEIFSAKPSKPINAKEGKIKETIMSQDLPPLENTDTNTNPTEFDDFESSFRQIMDELSTDKENKDANQDNEIDVHTFHIERQVDNMLEDLPAHSLLGAEENSDDKDNENTDPKLDHSSPLATDAETIQTMDEVQPRSADLVEISNNKIISSSDGRVKKRKQNDLLFVLSFLAVTVVAVALCLAFYNKMKETQSDTPANNSQNIVEEENNKLDEISKKLVDMSKKQDEISVAAQPEEINPVRETSTAEIQPISIEEQVINIVKDTKLPSKGKTIGEYLQNTYGAAYQSSWSAKPFTDKVYIVEFFASQVRSEPYVYLFRVDTDQRKITGALNNITLDLLA